MHQSWSYYAAPRAKPMHQRAGTLMEELCKSTRGHCRTMNRADNVKTAWTVLVRDSSQQYRKKAKNQMIWTKLEKKFAKQTRILILLSLFRLVLFKRSWSTYEEAGWRWKTRTSTVSATFPNHACSLMTHYVHHFDADCPLPIEYSLVLCPLRRTSLQASLAIC